MPKIDRSKLYTKDEFTFVYWGKASQYQWRVYLGQMHLGFASENDVARVLELQGV